MHALIQKFFVLTLGILFSASLFAQENTSTENETTDTKQAIIIDYVVLPGR